MLALESRMVFDGAMVTTDAVLDTSQAPLNTTAIDVLPIVHDDMASVTREVTVALATPAVGRNELVVVDGSLNDLQALLDEIHRIAPDRTVLVLNKDGDAV